MKLKYLIIFLICLTLFGCVGIKSPQRNEYVLNVKMPSKIKHPVLNKVLEVSSVAIAPQFSNLSFVYRVSDANYTRDYYNIFFNPPAQQIEQSIIKYLRGEHLFKYIASDASILPPNYILHSEVVAFYADYRDFKRPKAVIAIRFALFNDKTQILMDRVFSLAVALQQKDTQSLVYAWNSGLTEILKQLNNRLYSLVV